MKFKDDATDTEEPYWAFISYRHSDNKGADREWATWLHREIEQYEVPAELIATKNKRGDTIPERIYPVFRDEESLPADADLSTSISEALDRSKFLIVLCSPKAVESEYVAQEIQHFKNGGKSDRIIAAIIAGEPGDTESECFPLPLQEVVTPDGKLQEPIAADFRLPDGSEGYTSAQAYKRLLQSRLPKRQANKQSAAYDERLQLMKLKVIAGVLGLPLETIRDRDRAYQLAKAKRRQRLMTSIIFSLSTLALVAAGTSLLAWEKKSDAEKAEFKAVASEKRATNALKGEEHAKIAAQTEKDKAIRALSERNTSLREASNQSHRRAVEMFAQEKPKQGDKILAESSLIDPTNLNPILTSIFQKLLFKKGGGFSTGFFTSYPSDAIAISLDNTGQYFRISESGLDSPPEETISIYDFDGNYLHDIFSGYHSKFGLFAASRKSFFTVNTLDRIQLGNEYSIITGEAITTNLLPFEEMWFSDNDQFLVARTSTSTLEFHSSKNTRKPLYKINSAAQFSYPSSSGRYAILKISNRSWQLWDLINETLEILPTESDYEIALFNEDTPNRFLLRGKKQCLVFEVGSKEPIAKVDGAFAQFCLGGKAVASANSDNQIEIFAIERPLDSPLKFEVYRDQDENLHDFVVNDDLSLICMTFTSYIFIYDFFTEDILLKEKILTQPNIENNNFTLGETAVFKKEPFGNNLIGVYITDTGEIKGWKSRSPRSILEADFLLENNLREKENNYIVETSESGHANSNTPPTFKLVTTSDSKENSVVLLDGRLGIIGDETGRYFTAWGSYGQIEIFDSHKAEIIFSFNHTEKRKITGALYLEKANLIIFSDEENLFSINVKTSQIIQKSPIIDITLSPGCSIRDFRFFGSILLGKSGIHLCEGSIWQQGKDAPFKILFNPENLQIISLRISDKYNIDLLKPLFSSQTLPLIPSSRHSQDTEYSASDYYEDNLRTLIEQWSKNSEIWEPCLPVYDVSLSTLTSKYINNWKEESKWDRFPTGNLASLLFSQDPDFPIAEIAAMYATNNNSFRLFSDPTQDIRRERAITKLHKWNSEHPESKKKLIEASVRLAIIHGDLDFVFQLLEEFGYNEIKENLKSSLIFSGAETKVYGRPLFDGNLAVSRLKIEKGKPITKIDLNNIKNLKDTKLFIGGKVVGKIRSVDITSEFDSKGLVLRVIFHTVEISGNEPVDQLVQYDRPRKINAPKGFMVLDGVGPGAKKIKSTEEPSSLTVSAHQDSQGKRYYITEWSFNRMKGGSPPNFVIIR